MGTYELACILPHVTISVNKVIPHEFRSATTSTTKLELRFDLEAVDAEALIGEVHELLSMDLDDRSLSSKGGE